MVVWFFCRGDFVSARGVVSALMYCIATANAVLFVAMPHLFAGQAPAPQCKEKYLLTILSFWHVATLILVDFSHKRTRI